MKWMEKSPRWLIWGLVLPLVVLNGWLLLLLLDYFRSLVTILVSATILSFVLDYPVKWLQRRGILRFHAVLLVFLIALSFFLIVAVTIFPVLLEQVNEFINRLPVWLESGVKQLQAIQHWALVRRLPVDLTELVVQLQNSLSSQLQTLSSGVLSFGLGLVGSALDLTLTIVVTFYMLLHGDRLWDGIFQWLPTPLSAKLRRSLRRNFHNYFIGQATLASLMGLTMIVAFLIMQVPFGLLFGLVIGMMTLFPFGAVFSIWVVSFLVSLSSAWLGLRVLFVGILIDQSIESGIAPRLLGRFTGLNPVWVLIVLLLGARLCGLLGLVIAVPTAGFIKNMIDALRDPVQDASLDEE
ncbi:MAG TPA: AI-2E family transporter [Crinalium sp.]|jgi:predicted PurR-regulated permease PerM